MGGVFVGTFLIGLREGLEATLIVSIVGAFLRRNGHSLRPMFLGVGLAVLISVGVGVGLDALSASLPQAQQEMLETVIGAVAVVFVTTMIIWMNRNASRLKGELEREATEAMTAGGSLALVGMAFLAVLKEGFETAVFLLAAVQASRGGGGLALVGAVVGIAVSIGIGVAIYFGGVRINLGRFFRISGVFLILIAAGLVLSTLRTAHEAGWVNIGQQRVADLSSWMPTNSVLGALVTGLFGIPADPRLIEVLGWFLYAVPVLLVFLWPRRWAVPVERRPRLKYAIAGGLVLAAVLLALLVPASGVTVPGPERTAAVEDGGTVTVSVGAADEAGRPLTVVGPTGTTTVTLQRAGTRTVDGVDLDVWETKVPTDPGQTGTQTTLGELATLVGGRLPVGVNANATPGPFEVQWSANTAYTALTSGDSLVDAQAAGSRIATLRGGGLTGTKTVSVGGLGTDWAVPAPDSAAAAATLADAATDRAERLLWRVWLPATLLLAAVATAVSAVLGARSAPENSSRRETTAA